ncbi:MAG TPA: NAD(P)/FAD-dependent oxidoreductase [Thermoanaerobaculia bacterium]|nr:NAD(P)/FAD-dependent oxidoreductase [Thermoanaerobaculia bacterium]
MASPSYDAVIVGAGPNGLAAAVELARHGLGVLVVEARETVGGGLRSAELTRPGFVHDVCSAIHPMGIGSPCFSRWPLEDFGLEWMHPEVPLAHPLDGGRAAVQRRSVAETADGLGADGQAWRRLFGPLAERWDDLAEDVLRPVLRPPRHPLTLARFGLPALLPASLLAQVAFRGEPARALFAGIAAHTMVPLTAAATSAVALLLGTAAHAVGWPTPRGGAGRLADALAAYLRSLGGEIRTGWPVASLDELPPSRAVICDLTPKPFLAVAGHRLPQRYRRRLAAYRYGAGVFKVDYALGAPVPWLHPDCARAGTVHVGGSLDEIAAGEQAAFRGEVPERPFVLVAQQSLFDPTRAPRRQHTLWAYCHVPRGFRGDHTAAIEAQIERFAPGFGERVLERHVAGPADVERDNPNMVGGDIGGGIQDLRQVIARPVARPTPYRTPVAGLYLCSAATPPGAGIHGMGGWHAARAALADRFGGAG